MRKSKRSRLDARKSRRELYYSIGSPHANTLPENKKVSQVLKDYPSLRTFLSDIPSDVVELTARFNFYLSLAFPQKGTTINARNQKGFHHYLESVTEKLGCRISNYTLSGFISSKQYGPRHRPRQTTIESLNKLIVWLEDICRATGLWKPFKFRYHISEFDTPQPTKHETDNAKTNSKENSSRNDTRKESGKRFPHPSDYAAFLERCRQGDSD